MNNKRNLGNGWVANYSEPDPHWKQRFNLVVNICQSIKDDPQAPNDIKNRVSLALEELQYGSAELIEKGLLRLYTDAVPWSIAMMFHNIYEALALQYGYETRPETRFDDLPENNKQLMIATCKRLMVLLGHGQTDEELGL